MIYQPSPGVAQTIKVYMSIGTSSTSNSPSSALYPSDYIVVSPAYLQPVATITFAANPIIPSKSTYLGANIKYLSDVDTSTSTAIGYGANIDVSNQIVLGTSGEFVCIPSTKGLSIGKSTAPRAALDVAGAVIFSDISGNNLRIKDISANIMTLNRLFVSNVEITSGGGGGVTTDASKNTLVGGSIKPSTNLNNSTAVGFASIIDLSNQIVLGTSGEFVCIPSKTGLSIGKTTAPTTGYALDVSGSIQATTYNATSDYRIKDNVRNLDENDTISKLRPVKYINKLSNKNDFGLIAHELQTEYPELVSGTKDGSEYQSVNYTGLISILIKEVQDVKKIANAQAKQIESQAAQLERINKMLFQND
jgi:hypothetical protein